jgi:hypothetical protein
MAATGQVIYFTHHRHLCEIARMVEPAVIVHDLEFGTRTVSPSCEPIRFLGDLSPAA